MVKYRRSLAVAASLMVVATNVGQAQEGPDDEQGFKTAIKPYLEGVPGSGFETELILSAGDLVPEDSSPGGKYQIVGIPDGLGIAAHGGDTGSPISQALARSHPESVVVLHLTDIGYDKTMQMDPSTLSEAEQEYINILGQWSFGGATLTIRPRKAPGCSPSSLRTPPDGTSRLSEIRFYRGFTRL